MINIDNHTYTYYHYLLLLTTYYTLSSYLHFIPSECR